MKKSLLLLCAFFCTYCLYGEEPIIVRLSTENKLLSLNVNKIEQTQTTLSTSHLSELEKILNFDLSYNGMTHALAKNSAILALEKSSSFDGNDPIDGWKNQGIYYVIKLKLNDKSLATKILSINNRYTQTIDPINLTGDLSKDRRQIHRLADVIHRALFNTDGIASTHFLYAVKKRDATGNAENITTEIWEADYDGQNARRILAEPNLCINPTYLPPVSAGNASGAFLFVSYRAGQSKIFISSLKDGKSRRFSNLPGNQLMPSVSSNRTQLAFISDTTSRPDLFIQGMGADLTAIGKPQQIFTASFATQGSPSYSPDGKRIAFVSNKDGSPQIYLIDVPSLGLPNKNPKVTLVTKRSRENTAPAWSPDGTKIAYCALSSDGVRQIWIADLLTNQERQVTQGPGNKENPTWAPDSLHLIFNSASQSVSELYLVNLNQPEAIKISSGSGEKRFPAWEPRFR